MSPEHKSTKIPAGYHRIEGSERRPSPTAKFLGPSDPNETFSVTISVRRRPDGPPMPDMSFFATTPPSQRRRMPSDEFAAKYGASQDDLEKVTEFAKDQGLKVVESNAARRTVVVSGTVAQMNKAFAVKLGRYQHEIVRRYGEEPQTEIYRGRDGFIYVPTDLAEIIIGVFGLDNRRISKRAAAGDPPNTNPVTVPQLAQLYNFPPNSAAGQRIAVLSEGGYSQADLQAYYNGLPASYTSVYPMPIITPISVDASNGTPDSETTQDICIAFSAAPGADISVYFTSYDQAGWYDAITRVVHPKVGDAQCSVITTSFYISNGDDSATLTAEGVSTSWINAVNLALQDAAIQGVTFCVCSGDFGVNMSAYFGVNDGKQHVTYPASDPWALSVGGTTVGNIVGTTFDEYVWNDPNPSATWGTTGGGVSDYFTSLPSYQIGAGVPHSLIDNHVGRGVPDVAANASLNSGISGIYLNGNPIIGNGTSASTPLWAGLIALINAALGENIGFVNPAIYALGSSVFRDINPPPGPTDNSNGGVAGYPAGPGWDACTGWGSPNGVALLNGLRSIYNRNFYFIVDKSTFGVDEVSDVINVGGGLYTNAFWLVLEGFSIHQLGSNIPVLSGAFDNISGVSIFPDASGAEYEMPGDLYTPQRIRIPYDIIFSSAALTSFPSVGSGPQEDLLIATITISGTTLMAETLFELVSGADPYFTNIDPTHNNVFYLSQDLRVFSVAAGDTPLPGGPAFTNDPYQSAQNLLAFLNSNSAYTTPGPDPLNALPGQTGYETGDSSITPLNTSHNKNYNFAIARVRLQGAANSSASNVRAFFRLFVAQSCDTDFQPATTYLSQLGTSGPDTNKPVFPLPSGAGLTDPSGQSIQTIPFFITDANGTHDYDGTNANANIRTIQIPSGQDRIWAYFCCFLDVYDASNQSKFPGTHHCIVAEIAYDDAPIQNSGGVTVNPENSDKLAQRNLQITLSGNPGYPETHLIPQAFDMRPSLPISSKPGLLLNYPDELMIDWGNVPAGSVANIYWPQVSAHEVLNLATRLYGIHPLSASDPNTIKCKVIKGVTYIPIPSGTGKNFAGLFTLELPNNIHAGQEFNIKVRRIASRRVDKVSGIQDAEAQKRTIMRNWRYVTGTFQIKVPVGNDRMLLLPEENTLAILKWRLEHISPAYRWYPVLQKYISIVAGRVDGFGGNAACIKPSLLGAIEEEKCLCEEKIGYTGKVSGLIYDRFGDFEGFSLDTEDGEHHFCSREKAIEELADRAWSERLRITVWAERDEPHRPLSIVLREPPTSFHH